MSGACFNRKEGEIKALPEFQHSSDKMKSNEKISSMENHLVGTHSSASNTGDLSRCLISFLYQLYTVSSEPTIDVINKAYQDFESFFYDDKFIKIDSTLLFNFQSSENEIDLGDGIKIVRNFNNQDPADYFGREKGYRVFSKSNFLISRIYETKKIVRNAIVNEAEENPLDKDQTTELIREQEAPSPELFDIVIKSLRILKASGVYRDNEISSELISYTPHGGTQISSAYHENIVMGKKLIFDTSDIKEFSSIYSYITANRDSRLAVAYRRLSSGMERRNFEDQLIDYMIGLETLFLPDGTAELSFRLSLRVAFILNDTSVERKETFEFLRNIYGIRSKIVHGKQYSLESEDVLKIEEFLRQSIKLWIIDKNNFLHKITVEGNTSDGKLNSIFFD